MRDPLLLKYDIIIVCHFSHDCYQAPYWLDFVSATAVSVHSLFISESETMIVYILFSYGLYVKSDFEYLGTKV